MSLLQHLVYAQLTGTFGPYHAAVTRVEPGETTRPHDHDFPEWFLVLEGQGTHRINGRDHALHRGDWWFVRPADVHNFATPAGSSVVFFNFACAASWWEALRATCVPPLDTAEWEKRKPANTCHLEDSALGPLQAAALALLHGAGRTPTAAVRLNLQMLETVSRPQRGPVLEDKPGWLTSLLEDLRRPEFLTKDVTWWQKRAGRSPEHVARSCRRHCGRTLTDLINEARVAHVQLGLLTRGEKIATLAYEAGYENLGYFYRVFKRVAGSTPNVWLAAQRGVTVPR